MTWKNLKEVQTYHKNNCTSKWDYRERFLAKGAQTVHNGRANLPDSLPGMPRLAFPSEFHSSSAKTREKPLLRILKRYSHSAQVNFSKRKLFESVTSRFSIARSTFLFWTLWQIYLSEIVRVWLRIKVVQETTCPVQLKPRNFHNVMLICGKLIQSNWERNAVEFYQTIVLFWTKIKWWISKANTVYWAYKETNVSCSVARILEGNCAKHLNFYQVCNNEHYQDAKSNPSFTCQHSQTFGPLQNNFINKPTNAEAFWTNLISGMEGSNLVHSVHKIASSPEHVSDSGALSSSSSFLQHRLHLEHIFLTLRGVCVTAANIKVWNSYKNTRTCRGFYRLYSQSCLFLPTRDTLGWNIQKRETLWVIYLQGKIYRGFILENALCHSHFC